MSALSVIVLTRNRLAKVSRLIDRLLPQLAPGDELLLIDTGSDDGTREELARHPSAAVRLLTFDGEGSWAEMRNFGVAHARGGLIAFLDDDCLPAADWVACGKAALAEADAVGGMVQPLGIHHFPDWWHPEMAWMAGLSVPGQAGSDFGSDAGRVHYPFTANLWARRSVCRAAPFQELGGQLGGEESARYATGREDAQWWRRLRAEGYRARFDPLLTVGHAIDPLRLDLAYLCRRAGLDGRAWAAREGARLDLAPLAYQWWRQFFLALGAPWAEEGARRCHWHYHRLTCHRHAEALRGLAEKIFTGPGKAEGMKGYFHAALRPFEPWMIGAGCRLAWDRAKTAGRELLAPWLQSKPLRPKAMRVDRLAVIAFGYLGDLVILQSALRGLMKAHPGVELYVVAPPAGATVLKDVKRLNVTPTPKLKPGSRAAVKWLAGWLDLLDPDVIVAPYLHEPWGGTLTALRRPPRPVFGFDHDQGLKRMWQLERLAFKVHKNLALHESQNLCALFGAAGLPCEPLPARIEPRPDALERVRMNPWLADRQGSAAPIVMLNPDAGQAQKEWTGDAWRALIHRMLAKTGWRIVVNASRPRPSLVPVATAEAPERVLWLESAPLEDLIAWLSLCQGLVTVDAGTQHLAHALGVPSVTLYGPMDERRWSDFWGRPIHRTLRACACDLTPEERRGLPVNHEVSLIQPDAVFRLLKEIFPESDPS